MRNKFIKFLSTFLLGLLIFTQLATPIYAVKDNNFSLDQIDIETVSEKIHLNSDFDSTSSKNIEVIVELIGDPIRVQSLDERTVKRTRNFESAEQDIISVQNSFIESLNKLSKGAVEVKRQYQEVYNGVLLSLPENMIYKLASLPIVKSVWDNQEVHLDLPDYTSPVSPTMIETIPYLSIDKLHKEGITGKGIKVGIIDTGMDYNHPDLKDAYKGGYNFIDGRDSSNPMETTFDDWKNSGSSEFHWLHGAAYYTSHGTHVAGTIASRKLNNSKYSFVGVAPDAELYAYRAVGPYTNGSIGTIISAIEKTVEDGMDVVNMSIGVEINEPNHPMAKATNNASLSGTICVVSSGNSGPQLYTIGTPSTAQFAISVGAADFPMTVPVFTASIAENDFDLKLLTRSITQEITDIQGDYPIVNGGNGSGDELKNLDIEGKLLLIKKDTGRIDNKIKSVLKYNPKGVIIWNNEEGEVEEYLGEKHDLGLSFTMSQEDALELIEVLDDESQLSVKLAGNKITEGNHLASFSSNGPTKDNYHIKPEIVGPGVNVFSTVPNYLIHRDTSDSYEFAYTRMSGTSMSTPHITGIVALILDHNKGISPYEVRTRLINSGIDLNGDYNLFQQGAGRVDPYRAVKEEVTISTNNIYKDDETSTEYFDGILNLESLYMENQDVNVKKTIKIENAGSPKDFKIDFDFISLDGFEDPIANGLKFNIVDKVSLEADSSLDIDLNILIPENANQGFYQGVINFRETNGKNYKLPFSVRITGRGIKDLGASSNAMTLLPNHFLGQSFQNISISYYLYNPMKSGKLFLCDGVSEERLGFIRELKDNELLAETDISISKAFTGEYYPFIDGSETELSTDKVKVDSSAYYKIELEVVDTKAHKKYTDIFIDSEGPLMEYSIEPGIHELDDDDFIFDEELGEDVLWLEGQAYDKNIDLMNDNNYQLDQSENTIHFFENSSRSTSNTKASADGSFRYPIRKKVVEENKLDLDIVGIDYATSSNNIARDKFFFIKSSKPYATIRSNRFQVKKDDLITLTIGINNAEDFREGKFVLDKLHASRFGAVENVSLAPEFAKYIKDNKLDFNIRKEVTDKFPQGYLAKMYVELIGNTKNSYSGNIDILEVDYRMDFNLPQANAIGQYTLKEAEYTNSEGLTTSLPSTFFRLGFDKDEFELTNIKPDTDLELQTGEELEVSFNGPRNSKAYFNILLPTVSGEVDRIWMTETKAGYYQGKYIVDKGIKLENASILVGLINEYGETIEEMAPGKLTILEKDYSIKNIIPNKDITLYPGDDLEVSFNGPENGSGSFIIDGIKYPMEEVEEGYYYGKLNIPKEIIKTNKDIVAKEIGLELIVDGLTIEDYARGRFNVKVLPESIDPNIPTIPIPVIPSPIIKETNNNKQVSKPTTPEITKEEVLTIDKIFSDYQLIEDWARAAVEDLYNKNIIKGRENNNFDPKSSITRAEYLKLLVEAFKLNSQENNRFLDVKDNSWYKKYIDIGVTNKIASGIGSNKFGPELNITREDLAVMTYNLIKEKNLDTGTDNKEIIYKDADNISTYARESVEKLSQLKIINGKSNNNFDPNGIATRSEAAVIIYRLLNLNIVE